MIDIHSHLLPFADDGSNSEVISLELLNEFCRQGVTDIILTPHYRKSFCREKTDLIEKFNGFKCSVERSDIPVKIYLGQEIFYNEKVQKLLADGCVLSLNNSKYVLLEFNYNDYSDIADIVYEVGLKGYKPIIAHIERYTYITVEDVYNIKEHGGYIQINASSIVGKEQLKIKKFVKNLLKSGLVDFVSSDCHANRQVCMQDAYQYVQKKYGEEYAQKIFVLNAKEIIGG